METSDRPLLGDAVGDDLVDYDGGGVARGVALCNFWPSPSSGLYIKLETSNGLLKIKVSILFINSILYLYIFH